MKKYSVIYADPPWKLKTGRPFAKYTVKDGVQEFAMVGNKSRELSFPFLTIEEIKNINVKSISQDDCHLYLWVTNKHIQYAFDIIKDWGFQYSTTIVWAKNILGSGLGGTYKISTEFLLFATKGKLTAKEKMPGTWYNVKREYNNGYPQHSRKPEFFRKMIERVSPGPYVELFARRHCDGWDVFGNEVDNSIIIS